MTRVTYCSCMCRLIFSSTRNLQNSGQPATQLGSVVPTRWFTNISLSPLASFTSQLQTKAARLSSASSPVLFTNDETLKKSWTKQFPAAFANVSGKVAPAEQLLASRSWPTDNRRMGSAYQPWSIGLVSSSSYSSLADSALLSYYAKTGALSNRWLHTTAIAHSSKPSDDKDERNETEKQTLTEIDESKLTLYQKFKLMYRQYWYVLLPVHVATSVVWFGSFFIAAKNGVDIVPLLKALGITSEKILCHLEESNTGYVAVAYAMYKVATPARYTVTLGCTTFSINYLRNRGVIKPVPTKEELKVMYEDKRDEMLERRNEMREQFQTQRDKLQDKLLSNIEERREAIKDRFEERKHEMKDLFEERREELKQSLKSQSEKLEDSLDQFKKQELSKKASSVLHDLKENIEETKENVKNKLVGAKIMKGTLKTDNDPKN